MVIYSNSNAGIGRSARSRVRPQNIACSAPHDWVVNSRMDEMADLDWSDCPPVMDDPDGGDWLVMKLAPRVPIEALIVSHLDGESVEDVAGMFEVDVDEVIRAL
jgi:hypothetical protein